MIVPHPLNEKQPAEAFDRLTEEEPREELDKLKEVSFYRTLDCLFNDESVPFEREELSCRRIMLVDPFEETRLDIAQKLERNGFEVTKIESGSEALEKVESINPDLILIEIIMSEMDGLVVCESLRQNERFAELPIIFLSSISDKKFVVRGLQAGASDYITKPFDEDEAVARVHAHLKLRELTIEKEKSNDKLQAANTELQKVNAAKDRLLGVTTHDLKNPLAAIRGILEFLDEEAAGPMNEDQHEMVREVMNATDSMLELVKDLLNFSTMEADRFKIETEMNDLGDIVSNVANLSQFYAEKKAIRLHIDLEETSFITQFDVKQVRRVAQNLIGNAIKFSPTGRNVYIKMKSKDDRLFVLVEDEGKGVPLEEQHKLFKEYGTTSTKSTAGETSTGLGLSICKKIIGAHGGEIWMQNRAEGGAEFGFWIPRVV